MKKLIILIYYLTIFSSVVLAQYNFIGKKFNSNLVKPIPSSFYKSGDTIPKMDFKFDSIRPLNELKTGYGEFYPWLSPDGNRIYYSENMISNTKIYMAEKKPGEYKFSNPHPLSVNSSDNSTWNYSAWLTDDELNIYFVQAPPPDSGFYFCHAKRDSINQNFSTPVKVKLKGIGNIIYTLGAPSLTQDTSKLYLGVESNGVSNRIYGICIFNKTADNEYTYEDTLHIPKGYSSGNGTLTSDNLNYFLTMGIGIHPIFYVFKRDSVNEQFSKLYYINNPLINEIDFAEKGTPYFCTSNSIFSFIKGDSGLTHSSLIYLAYNFKETDNITEINKTTNYIKVFPNPTQNYIELLSFKSQQSYYYNITDITGQSVKSGLFTNYIVLDISSFINEIYILTIIDKNDNQKANYKIIKL